MRHLNAKLLPAQWKPYPTTQSHNQADFQEEIVFDSTD